MYFSSSFALLLAFLAFSEATGSSRDDFGRLLAHRRQHLQHLDHGGLMEVEAAEDVAVEAAVADPDEDDEVSVVSSWFLKSLRVF